MPSDLPCSDCRQDVSAKVKFAESLWGCIDESRIRLWLRLDASAVVTLRLQVQIQSMIRNQQDMGLCRDISGVCIYICRYTHLYVYMYKCRGYTVQICSLLFG